MRASSRRRGRPRAAGPRGLQSLPFESPGRESAAPSVLRVRPAPPPPSGPGGSVQGVLAFEPRELWLALHVRQLPLTAVSREREKQPIVVIDGADRQQRVLQVDAAARALGVRSGMSLAAALAVDAQIDARPRDVGLERALIERLAAMGQRFTSRVSIEPPDGVLLEVKGSLKLFGGIESLREQVQSHYAASGVRVSLALAPTTSGALAAARAGRPLVSTDLQALPGQLAPLSLRALRWPRDTLSRLAAMGVLTIGEALRLPRTGFARRFGPATLASLDRLVGRREEPRRAYIERERFYGRFEPAYEITQHDLLLAVLQPLLADLERFLQGRQRGITRLRCRFTHREVPPTCCTLSLAAPEARAARLGELLAEKLAQQVLPQAVILCELRTGPLVNRELVSGSIWSPGEHGHTPAGEMPALIEQLRARLGVDAVYGLCLVPEHRPESAWRVAEPGATRSGCLSVWSPFNRPLWLLTEPQLLQTTATGMPRYHGPLLLSDGPERIETGWWDGADVMRDYYTAVDARRARLWIFRERLPPNHWFLHGVFG
ncbi:MAG: DNA polymerase Y family protein [Steroidobacteraceae bacterium]